MAQRNILSAKPPVALVENLAQTFSSQANAQMIYGKPIERKGITVIPVGKIRYGLGGGSGASKKEGEGSGGGGGMLVTPIGYIELVDGTSHFRRINSHAALLQMIGAVTLGGAWLILQGVKAFRS